MLNTTFAPWPSYSEEEAEAVHKVLLSNKVNYWTGSECHKFEEEFAQWTKSNHAITLSSGTVALDIALKAINICAGDEVIVTPRTFFASVSCVVNACAVPVFADVDENSGNITAETIQKVLSPRTKAVICVHLAGWPCDMDPIMELAQIHGLKVIEDCAQAHGAHYKGRSTGTIGDIGAWSFCQDKIMTTGGEGGMVTTNDETLWRAMWAYKDHGKSYKAVYEREHSQIFRWLHESFGTNWRMTEIQAAIGRIQLKRMNDWTAIRTANANKIFNTMKQFTGENGVLHVPKLEPISSHAYYKFYAYVRPENLASGWSRNRIINEINALGVPCYYGICSECYLEKAFDNTRFRPAERLPVAKKLGETSLMLLVHPTLTTKEIKQTEDAIKQVLKQASIQIDGQCHQPPCPENSILEWS